MNGRRKSRVEEWSCKGSRGKRKQVRDKMEEKNAKEKTKIREREGKVRRLDEEKEKVI